MRAALENPRARLHHERRRPHARSEFEARVKRDEPMSRHTSWHVGGPADVYFSPRDRADLLGVPAHAARRHAAVLARPRQQPAGARRRHPRRRHRHARRPRRASNASATPRSRCEAGVPCARLARQCIKWGLGPAEFLAGIPGHARRRAGDERRRVRRRDLAARAQRRRVRRARRRAPRATRANTRTAIATSCRRRRASASSPRRSSSSTRPGVTDDAMRELLAKRKATQPIGEWSCGSTFTNPPGDHAARLIEAAGLKGFRIGDIMVSPKHANFLVNVEAATRRRRREARRAHPGTRRARSSACALDA